MGCCNSKLNPIERYNPPLYALNSLEFLYQFNRDSIRFMMIRCKGFGLTKRELAWGFLNNKCPRCSSKNIQSLFDTSQKYAKWKCTECDTTLEFIVDCLFQ